MNYSSDLPVQSPNIPSYIVPANKTNQTLIFVIVILLLIIVGGGGFILAKYLYSPKPASDISTQQSVINQPATNSFSNLNTEKAATNPAPVDETSSWKTYTNDQFGFSLKYPETSNLSASGSTGILISNLETGIIKDDGWWFDMYVSENKEMMSSKARADQFIASVFSKEEINKDQIMPIEVGGYPAERISGPPEPNKPKALLVFLSKGGKFFNFHILRSEQEPFPGYYQKTEKIFDQILSTFKFL